MVQSIKKLTYFIIPLLITLILSITTYSFIRNISFFIRYIDNEFADIFDQLKTAVIKIPAFIGVITFILLTLIFILKYTHRINRLIFTFLLISVILISFIMLIYFTVVNDIPIRIVTGILKTIISEGTLL